jgi:hypothetical protein
MRCLFADSVPVVNNFYFETFLENDNENENKKQERNENIYINGIRNINSLTTRKTKMVFETKLAHSI